MVIHACNFASYNTVQIYLVKKNDNAHSTINLF